MHIFIRSRQFFNSGPADQQLDALSIRTLGAHYIIIFVTNMRSLLRLFRKINLQFVISSFQSQRLRFFDKCS